MPVQLAMQILEDKNRLDGSLADEIVVITGCSSGIGARAVEAMAVAGCTMYGGVRSACVSTAKEALSSVLHDPKTQDKVHILELGVANIASIETFAHEIKKWEKMVNILINNAGVMAIPKRKVTVDGFECSSTPTTSDTSTCSKTPRTTCLLAGPKASPGFASRIISLGSVGHRVV